MNVRTTLGSTLLAICIMLMVSPIILAVIFLVGAFTS